MRLIDAGKAKLSLDWTLIGDAADAACRVIDNATTVDAVPLQDLVQLRDELYENDAILMSGLRILNQFIAEHEK